MAPGHLAPPRGHAAARSRCSGCTSTTTTRARCRPRRWRRCTGAWSRAQRFDAATRTTIEERGVPVEAVEGRQVAGGDHRPRGAAGGDEREGALQARRAGVPLRLHVPRRSRANPRRRKAAAAAPVAARPPRLRLRTAASTHGRDGVDVPTRRRPARWREMLAELRKRRTEIDGLIKKGDFGAIWVPAFQAKDLAVALEPHVGHLGAAASAAHAEPALGRRRANGVAARLRWATPATPRRSARAFTAFDAAVSRLLAAFRAGAIAMRCRSACGRWSPRRWSSAARLARRRAQADHVALHLHRRRAADPARPVRGVPRRRRPGADGADDGRRDGALGRIDPPRAHRRPHAAVVGHVERRAACVTPRG